MQESQSDWEATLAPERSASASTSVATAVVGVGASTGGLESIQLLLGALPTDTGLAFVFVQHLDAAHPSLLTEILSRATSMRVLEVVAGMTPLADHVYVMPAQADIVLADGAFQLISREEAVGAHLPIDRFFGSLADAFGSRSIAVVLSGAGADGALGVRLIKSSGGLTFAQASHEAASPDMPAAAVATGCVDLVLTAEAIGADIVRLSRGDYFDVDAASVALDAADEVESLKHILSALLKASGIDFSLYRESTVRRRIARRIALRKVAGVRGYEELVAEDPVELALLQADLLIGVTRFFRDPQMFESLAARVFPKLLHGRPLNEPVRIWVPGCATGEEALSIAICLLEHMERSSASFPIQIFASDINESAVADARRGFYSANIAVDVDAERLSKYFEPAAGGFVVREAIRELCVFTRHNLLADPPFSRLDLISCRNVLMYLVGAQRSILRLFHYALKPDGFLVLGPAESAPLEDMFSAVDVPNRIYGKRATTLRLPALTMPSRGARTTIAPTGRVAGAARTQLWDSEHLRKRVDRLLLARFSPPAVVVSDSCEILELRGDVSGFLGLPDGAVSFNLVKLIHDTGLYLQVEQIVREALERDESVRRERLDYIGGGVLRSVTLEAIPMATGDCGVALVLFESVAARPELAAAGAQGSTSHVAPDGLLERQVVRLTKDLEESRQRIADLIEDYQDSREELQNATEEALSANEELRSLNEELETAKEEAQCANEELGSLNAELRETNDALVGARDQALSILASVQQPLVVLDRSSRVVNANESFQALFQLQLAGIRGRELTSLANGMFAAPELRALLAALLSDGSPPSLELACEAPSRGRMALVVTGRRVRRLDLLLLSIEDLTERRANALALNRAEDKLRRAEKLESIGRLAGGIAHDFNNLLTAISGYSSMLGELLADRPDALELLKVVDRSAEKAASLTRQLLALGRRQVLQPKVIDLNAVVSEFETLLRRLVGARIRCVLEREAKLWRVRADPGEIARVLMNLVLNARDAMPNGGLLAIRTTNLQLASDSVEYEGVAPGRYVTLTVGDTGPGMVESVRAQIFEPFFTTKDLAHGAGLGLAAVLGIVEQSGGVVRCRSTVGVGSSFAVLLPAVDAELDDGPSAALLSGPAPTGTETVLLAEDEDEVREFARRALVRSGYNVLVARDGQEGLEICRQHEGVIHLLATDVVMPNCGGRELAAGFLELRPNARVVFLSGYAPDVNEIAQLQADGAFLQKPFTPFELATIVRRTLDSGAG